ncbi:MAG: hypothetical protein QGH07_11110 [Alphaproteobacteria bacterium]|nr:hypothetical protein [Alphaproteobacteria bacterium]
MADGVRQREEFPRCGKDTRRDVVGNVMAGQVEKTDAFAGGADFARDLSLVVRVSGKERREIDFRHLFHRTFADQRPMIALAMIFF